MDMRSKLFTAIFNYIDFTAPTKEVNESYLNILAEIHSDYCNMKNEISQLKRKNADLRFKNAELCEELFKLSH
jgi:hypothetical protein